MPPTEFAHTVSRRWRNTLMIGRLLGPYLAFGALKRIVSLPRLVRWAWLRPAGDRDRATEATALQCVVRLRTWLGAERGDCLHGSLALYRVLSRAGSNPTLVVGFRRDASTLAGHAWVEVDDACVVEAPPSQRGFIPSISFGCEGTLLSTPDARGTRQRG